MKVLVEFFWDCGRQGDVDGVFVTTKEELEKAYGKEVYFGEILGKHSEIYGTLDRDDIAIKSEDQELIEKMIKVMGSDTFSGYNPLLRIQNQDDED